MEDLYTFSYDSEALLISLAQGSCFNLHLEETDNDKYNGKSFHNTLITLWDKAQDEGLFRYKYDLNAPRKIIHERFGFIAEFNPDRATRRRKPQEISCPNQPFNSDDFNFNKINQKEKLIKLIPMHESSPTNEWNHYVIINASPLEYGHVLLVPQSEMNHPQRITEANLTMALEMILLNHSRDFRVGFNSLCAYASVNHHHYHGYYLNHRLFIESAELKTIFGPCKELSDKEYPAPCFVFVLEESSQKKTNNELLNSFIKDVWKLISYFQNQNIAHNVYITRGSSKNIVDHFDSIRLFVWGRTSSFGSKECAAFNPALCELAGHFSIKSEEIFQSLNTGLICDELNSICEEIYSRVRKLVPEIYKEEIKVS